MGRRKRSKTARLENLGILRKVSATTASHIPTIDEVPDKEELERVPLQSTANDNEFYLDLLEELDEGDMTSEEIAEEAHAPANEAAITVFASFLTQVQLAAAAAVKEEEDKHVQNGGRRKRGKYTGRSKRTIQLHRQQGKQAQEAVAKSNQTFITRFAPAGLKRDTPDNGFSSDEEIEEIVPAATAHSATAFIADSARMTDDTPSVEGSSVQSASADARNSPSTTSESPIDSA